MPKHKAPRARRAPRAPFRPSLPHVHVPRVVVAAVSLGSLTVAAFTIGLMATAGAGGAAPAVPVAVSTPTSAPTYEPLPAEPVATLDPPAVLSETEAPEAATGTVSRALHEAPAVLEDVPVEARAAYERAAAVLSDARAGCRIDWTVLAGVGLVESDHGRTDDRVLDAEGATTPALYGEKLNGKKGAAKVRDTDAGRLDDQRTWDRTVGPLNFLPSKWLVVGVDADDDGRRDPQDIDDAALAAGVFLCSADRDLSATKALRAVLADFNPAEGYAGQVLTAAASYAADLEALEDAVADAPVVVVEEPVEPDPDDAKSDEPKPEEEDEADEDEELDFAAGSQGGHGDKRNRD